MANTRTNQPSPLSQGVKEHSDQDFRSVDHCVVPERNNEEWTISWYRSSTFVFLWWLWLPLAVAIRTLEALDVFPWLLFVLNKAFDIIASLFGIEYYEYEVGLCGRVLRGVGGVGLRRCVASLLCFHSVWAATRPTHTHTYRPSVAPRPLALSLSSATFSTQIQDFLKMVR